jgi:hypothetical protein
VVRDLSRYFELTSSWYFWVTRQSMRICYVAPRTENASPESVVSLDSYRDW